MSPDRWSKKVIRKWLLFRGFYVCERFSLVADKDELLVYNRSHGGWRKYRRNLAGFRDALYDCWLSCGAPPWGDRPKDTPSFLRKRIERNDGLDVQPMLSSEIDSEPTGIGAPFVELRKIRRIMALSLIGK